MAELDL